MSDPEALEKARRYVETARAKGQSDDSIKWSLIEKGWTKKAVDALWDSLSPRVNPADPSTAPDGEMVLKEALAWHGEGLKAGEGTLTLTTRRLVFRPTRGIVQLATTEVPLREIVAVRETRTPTLSQVARGGLIAGPNRVLAFRERSDRIHKFMLEQAECSSMAARVRDHLSDRTLLPIESGHATAGEREESIRQREMPLPTRRVEGAYASSREQEKAEAQDTQPVHEQGETSAPVNARSSGQLTRGCVGCLGLIGLLLLASFIWNEIGEAQRHRLALSSIHNFVAGLNEDFDYDVGVTYTLDGVHRCGDGDLVARIGWHSPVPLNEYGWPFTGTNTPLKTNGDVHCVWSGTKWSKPGRDLSFNDTLDSKYMQGTPVR